MRRFWNWLLVENHLKAVTFLTGVVVTLISGAFALFVYLDSRPSPNGTIATQESTGAETTIVTADPPPGDPDQALRDLLVGRWSGGQRFYPPNLTLNVEYTIAPNGTFNWTGKNAFMTLLLSGTWSVDDGIYSSTVTSSNFPNIVPANSSYSSEILQLDRNVYSYIDNITGERVTDRRL